MIPTQRPTSPSWPTAARKRPRSLAASSSSPRPHKAADLPSPTGSSLVRRVHAGIRRTLGTAQQGKAPAVVGDLKLMLEKLPNTRVGLRDRALLLLGFAGAFRRSELVSLDVADLEFARAGMIVTLRRSKADQEGRSRRLASLSARARQRVLSARS